MHGLLVIDKARGPTCQEVLSRIGKVLQIKKLGHSGTLDPFATGVLPVFLGAGTKLIPFINEGRKIYEGVLELGKATDTLDETGQVVCLREVPPLSDFQIEEVFARFLGEQEQTPPLFSAVKVKGRPLYKYARQGKAVKVPPRRITIFSLKLLGYQNHLLHFQTEVSRGTYIRVMASEIAEAMGTVGTLKELRRIQSGPFSLRGSISVDTLENTLKNKEDIQEVIYKNIILLLNEFDQVKLTDPFAIGRLLNGQAIPWEWKGTSLNRGEGVERSLVALGDREILSVCRFESLLGAPQGLLKPIRILHIPYPNF